MIEAEKEHYLYAINKYVFPQIISEKYSWHDLDLWRIFSHNYNKEINSKGLNIVKRTKAELIGMGKVLKWCNCVEPSQVS
uniref:Uncharacterized protein n=1 Tax=Amaranthus palmeri TaxID=107608 RepID=A0A6C0T514_AMAPA|nr:hypothetical protein AP_R.00g000145-v1.0.a3 [Amaranthus palmeri]